MRKRISIAALPVLVALSIAHPGAQAPATPQELRVPYTEFTLPNGLHVILHRDASVPIVAVNTWYHVGSANEKPGRTGFAHLFEHLMFEGSKNVTEGAFDTLLESAGGNNNGSTNPDRTNYYEDIPANALELALFLDSDRMGYLLDTMTPARVDGQRDVVKNERRQSYENQPYGRASLELSNLLYPKNHPYNWPTIGSMEDLSAASRDDVAEFFKTYYAPNNASLVIAGDIDLAETRRLVEKWFGEIPRGPAVPPIAPPAAVLDGVKKQTMTDRVQLPRLYLAWHTPAIYQPGDAAMDIAASLMTGGKNARLYRRLVYELQIAQDVNAFQQSQGLGSVFTIVATARPGQTLEKIQQVIDEELDKLRMSPADDREMTRSLNQIEANFYRQMERVGGFSGKANQLNAYYTRTGMPDYFASDLGRYRSLSAADIQSAIDHYLPKDRRVELSVVPREVGGELTMPFLSRPIVVAALVALAGTIGLAQKPDRSTPPKPGPPPALKLPPIQKQKLSNGLAVWIVEQHEVPLAQVNLIVKAGSAADPAGKYGVGSMTAAMLDEGAGGKSALELADAIEFLGASLGTSSTFDYSSVRLSVPVARLGDALPLMADVVIRPAFPADELERLRKERLTRLLQARDDPAAIVEMAFPRLVFGDKHRYGTPAGGDGAVVKALTLDDLRSFHRSYYRPELSTLLVVGDVRAATVTPVLEKAFGSWKGEGTAGSTTPLPAAAQLTARRIYIVDKPGAAQSQIRIGWVGVPRSTPDYPTLQVLNTILGGSFTSRLNTNLRETHGYSSGAFSSFEEQISPGAFSARAGVQTDKTAEALKEFFVELTGILKPIPGDELDKARNYVALGFPAEFESTGNLAQKMEEQVVHGLPDEYFASYIRAVVQTTGPGVEKAAARYIQPDRFAVVVVGDRKTIESGIRALNLGPVEILSVEQALGPL